MDSRIIDAILSRINGGSERVRCEEIAEEVFGPHYAASDSNAAARLDAIQEMLRDDAGDEPGSKETRWYWERALEQFRVAPTKEERSAVIRAMRKIAASRPECEYRGGLLILSRYAKSADTALSAEERRERQKVERMLRELQAIILSSD